MLGKHLQDPDADSMAEFCEGVRIGVGVELKRTPAVWPPKQRWPLGEFGEDPVVELNNNYPSAVQRRHILLDELKEQISRGWAVSMTLGEAKARFGEVSVAPLAVIEEKDGKTRTLYDASNRVQINHRIKVRDGEHCPSSLDVQAAISGDSSVIRPIVSIVVDAEKAHQQVPLSPLDWGWVAFSADPMPENQCDLDSWQIAVKTV